jgi:hypothetical protein
MAANLIGFAYVIQINNGIAHTASLSEGRMILSKLRQQLIQGVL